MESVPACTDPFWTRFGSQKMIQIKRGSHFLTQDGSHKENTTGLALPRGTTGPLIPRARHILLCFPYVLVAMAAIWGFVGGSIKLAAAVVDEAHGVYGTATWAFSPSSGGSFGAVSNGETSVPLWGSNSPSSGGGIDALSEEAADWVSGIVLTVVRIFVGLLPTLGSRVALGY